MTLLLGRFVNFLSLVLEVVAGAVRSGGVGEVLIQGQVDIKDIGNKLRGFGKQAYESAS